MLFGRDNRWSRDQSRLETTVSISVSDSRFSLVLRPTVWARTRGPSFGLDFDLEAEISASISKVRSRFLVDILGLIAMQRGKMRPIVIDVPWSVYLSVYNNR